MKLSFCFWCNCMTKTILCRSKDAKVKRCGKCGRNKDMKLPFIPFKIAQEIQHYRKTRVPRCHLCKKDYIKVTSTKVKGKEIASEWKSNCEHSKNLRLMVG